MAEVYRVIVVGEEGAGRTSLLEYVFMQPDSGRKRGMNRKTAMAEDAQAVLAVFSSENIQNPKVWSFLERYCPEKKPSAC